MSVWAREENSYSYYGGGVISTHFNKRMGRTRFLLLSEAGVLYFRFRYFNLEEFEDTLILFHTKGRDECHKLSVVSTSSHSSYATLPGFEQVLQTGDTSKHSGYVTLPGFDQVLQPGSPTIQAYAVAIDGTHVYSFWATLTVPRENGVLINMEKVAVDSQSHACVGFIALYTAEDDGDLSLQWRECNFDLESLKPQVYHRVDVLALQVQFEKVAVHNTHA